MEGCRILRLGCTRLVCGMGCMQLMSSAILRLFPICCVHSLLHTADVKCGAEQGFCLLGLTWAVARAARLVRKLGCPLGSWKSPPLLPYTTSTRSVSTH